MNVQINVIIISGIIPLANTFNSFIPLSFFKHVFAWNTQPWLFHVFFFNDCCMNIVQ